MRTLLTLAISIAIFCDPLFTNGSPLQSDINRRSSNHSYATPATMEEIESILGISPTKDGLFQIDDVFFTAKEIQKNFGIGLDGKNGQPDESKRWPKSASASGECQSIQITLSGGALAAQGSRQGVYVKSATSNGKLSWTSTNTALWWVPDQSGWWTVGSKTDIGKNAGDLDTFGESVSGPPYGNGDVWWYKDNAGEWKKAAVGEITVECSTFANGQINGTMPVTFHSSVTSDEKVKIKAQMDRFNAEMVGCLQFVDRTTESDYVEVNSHHSNADPNSNPGGGCYSQGLGRNGNGKQAINLERAVPGKHGGCMSTGTIIHEFIHAWGFWHEQTRPDRDSFVKIIENNITPGLESQFWIQSSSYTFDVPYDGGSVMHYNDKAFGIKECQTIKITLFGGALSAQKPLEGVYVKSAKENGKLSWTKGSHALWWGSNGVWIVGSKTSIGGTSGSLYSPESGQPYDNINDWFYHNGNAWVNPISEITVECTSLEKQTTIEPLPTYNFDPSGFGQRVWMTQNDAMKLKKMYMCEPRGGGEFFGPSGVVDSPEWPRPYSNFADCYLKITCDSGEKVKLQFLTFDIEDHSSCQYDWLSITDTPYGDPVAGPYCGSTKPPNYLSASNYAGVYFRSDEIQTAAGFEIKYTCIKDNVSNCKDKKPEKKCKKWKKKGKCKKKKVAKKCKKTCGKC